MLIILTSFTFPINKFPNSDKNKYSESYCYLQLIRVTCNSQEDWTGTDQIYFKLDGERVTKIKRIKSGQTLNLKNIDPIIIKGSGKLSLYEYDIDSSDDLLVRDFLRCSVRGAGKETGTHWTADYKIEYIIY